MSRNRAKCLNCGDIIESKHRNDFVKCKCALEWDTKFHEWRDLNFRVGSKTFISSFGEYEIPIFDDAMYDDPEYKAMIKTQCGFFLDGGKDYVRSGGNPDHILWLGDKEDIDVVTQQIQDSYK